MAVTITPEDVTNVAPEFSSLEDETIQTYIEVAQSLICADKFGSKAKNALIFLTAHLMKDIGLGGGGSGSSSTVGPITSEKVGDLQRSYGQLTLTGGSVTDQLLATTKYGKTYIMIRKSIPVTPMVT